MNQNHQAAITIVPQERDRTGKFQDEVIEKPGEEFGAALYEWLAGGKAEIPAAPAEETPPKPQKASTVTPKPKAEKPAAPPENGLKEKGAEVMKEIGNIITAAKDGAAYFTEAEKEEARQIIRETKADEKGIKDLEEFKVFLADELAKRESKKAA